MIRAPASSTVEPRTGWILYDADCAVCTGLARSWSRTLASLGLSVAPLQSPWVGQRTGLAGAELVRDIRLLENDGRLISGPDVYRYVMRRLWWTYPLFLLSRVPGLAHVFDWTYRTFARHRGKFSARCTIPPA
jgi:predicted DCC family thiol-disulfide oxidoreductase YuxK